MNKRYLAISLFFFALALLCLINLLTHEFQSYSLTGAIVFPLLGIGFLRRAKRL